MLRKAFDDSCLDTSYKGAVFDDRRTRSSSPVKNRKSLPSDFFSTDGPLPARITEDELTSLHSASLTPTQIRSLTTSPLAKKLHITAATPNSKYTIPIPFQLKLPPKISAANKSPTNSRSPSPTRTPISSKPNSPVSKKYLNTSPKPIKLVYTGNGYEKMDTSSSSEEESYEANLSQGSIERNARPMKPKVLFTKTIGTDVLSVINEGGESSANSRASTIKESANSKAKAQLVDKELPDIPFQSNLEPLRVENDSPNTQNRVNNEPKTLKIDPLNKDNWIFDAEPIRSKDNTSNTPNQVNDGSKTLRIDPSNKDNWIFDAEPIRSKDNASNTPNQVNDGSKTLRIDPSNKDNWIFDAEPIRSKNNASNTPNQVNDGSKTLRIDPSNKDNWIFDAEPIRSKDNTSNTQNQVNDGSKTLRLDPSNKDNWIFDAEPIRSKDNTSNTPNRVHDKSRKLRIDPSNKDNWIFDSEASIETFNKDLNSSQYSNVQRPRNTPSLVSGPETVRSNQNQFYTQKGKYQPYQNLPHELIHQRPILNHPSSNREITEKPAIYSILNSSSECATPTSQKPLESQKIRLSSKESEVSVNSGESGFSWSSNQESVSLNNGKLADMVSDMSDTIRSSTSSESLPSEKLRISSLRTVSMNSYDSSSNDSRIHESSDYKSSRFQDNHVDSANHSILYSEISKDSDDLEVSNDTKEENSEEFTDLEEQESCTFPSTVPLKINSSKHNSNQVVDYDKPKQTSDFDGISNSENSNILLLGNEIDKYNGSTSEKRQESSQSFIQEDTDSKLSEKEISSTENSFNEGLGKRFSFPNSHENVTNNPEIQEHMNDDRMSLSNRRKSFMSADGQIEIPDLPDNTVEMNTLFNTNSLSRQSTKETTLESLGVPGKSAQDFAKKQFNILFPEDSETESEVTTKSQSSLHNNQTSKTPSSLMRSRNARHSRNKSMYNFSDYENLIHTRELTQRSKDDLVLSNTSTAKNKKKIQQLNQEITAKDLPNKSKIQNPEIEILQKSPTAPEDSIEPLLENKDSQNQPNFTISDETLTKSDSCSSLIRAKSLKVEEPPKPVQYKIDFVDNKSIKTVRDNPINHKYNYSEVNNALKSINNWEQPKSISTSSHSSYQSSGSRISNSTKPTDTESIVVDLTDEKYEVCIVKRSDSVATFKSVTETTKDGKKIDVVLVDDDDGEDELASIYSKYNRDWDEDSFISVPLSRSNSQTSSEASYKSFDSGVSSLITTKETARNPDKIRRSILQNAGMLSSSRYFESDASSQRSNRSSGRTGSQPPITKSFRTNNFNYDRRSLRYNQANTNSTGNGIMLTSRNGFEPSRLSHSPQNIAFQGENPSFDYSTTYDFQSYMKVQQKS